MQLLASWRDSLMIFKWSNFKLFLLVTLKAFLEFYTTWLKYWWWLILGVIAVNFFMWDGRLLLFDFLAMGPYTMDFVVGYHQQMMQSLLLLPVIVLFFMALFLSIRPSLAIKNMSYFLGFVKQYFWLCVWFLLFPLAWLEFVGFFAKAGFPVFTPLYFGLFVYCSLLISILFIFFLNDSDGSMRSFFASMRNAFIMFIFNLPFYIISMVLLFALMTIIGGLFLMIGSILFKMVIEPLSWVISLYIVSFLELLLFLPLIITVLNNFYIKRLHEQFTLYYKG